MSLILADLPLYHLARDVPHSFTPLALLVEDGQVCEEYCVGSFHLCHLVVASLQQDVVVHRQVGHHLVEVLELLLWPQEYLFMRAEERKDVVLALFLLLGFVGAVLVENEPGGRYDVFSKLLDLIDAHLSVEGKVVRELLVNIHQFLAANKVNVGVAQGLDDDVVDRFTIGQVSQLVQEDQKHVFAWVLSLLLKWV